MNKHNLHIDLIEKYLENSLDKEEVELFNTTLENDEEFVRDLNDMEVLIAGIKKAAAKTSIEEKLERFHQSNKKTEETHEKKTIIRYLSFERINRFHATIAASIAILLVASVTFFNINPTPSHQKLYTQYYAPFENYGNKRSADIQAQNYWQLALAYYDYEKYDSALVYFERMQASNFKGTIKYPSFSLYKGNTLMKLGRHDEAAVIFQKMMDRDDGMVMHAKWYLSMCYLYENNPDKLLPLLEEIAEVKASAYHDKAQEIINQLK